LHASPGPITTDLPLPQERVDAELAPVAVAEHCEVLLSVGFSTRSAKKIARRVASDGRLPNERKNPVRPWTIRGNGINPEWMRRLFGRISDEGLAAAAAASSSPPQCGTAPSARNTCRGRAARLCWGGIARSWISRW